MSFPKGVATIFFKRRDFLILLVTPVDLFLTIQTFRNRYRSLLAQHTVPPADDALGRKRCVNVLVVEVVVVSGEKTFES
eukprot:COSAG02_NODE_3576_length_6538_cov_3.358907_4_plen_79_part_00